MDRRHLPSIGQQIILEKLLDSLEIHPQKPKVID